jgi:hypothetical protein
MTKVALNKKKSPFFSKLDFNLKEELMKCCIWSIAFIVLNLGK